MNGTMYIIDYIMIKYNLMFVSLHSTVRKKKGKKEG